MNPPRDTHEMEAMLFQSETRAIANGMIARMQAFVARWRDQRENHETPATALRRVRWMLKAIGAKVTVIPGANHGDAKERIARYLITFDSPLGCQSLQILETNEALYAKLENQLERMKAFITAFPERLLTGERPEPAFLISKPYSEEQVRSAVAQAMFFSSTETLRA